MTITNPQIISEMLLSQGRYPGDPTAQSIYRFQTADGKENYAVFFPGDTVDIERSPYVQNPVKLWEGDMTDAGEAWIKAHPRWTFKVGDRVRWTDPDRSSVPRWRDGRITSMNVDADDPLIWPDTVICLLLDDGGEAEVPPHELRKLYRGGVPEL